MLENWKNLHYVKTCEVGFNVTCQSTPPKKKVRYFNRMGKNRGQNALLGRDLPWNWTIYDLSKELNEIGLFSAQG